MKIKGRNIINTSQYSFIGTAHETEFIFLFVLIEYVRLIIDLLRCLFDLAPCDSQIKKWTLHSITGAYIKWFKDSLADLQERCQGKTIIIKCRCFWKDSAGFVLCEPYLQITISPNLENSKLEMVDGMGCTSRSPRTHRSLREKKANIFPCVYKQRQNQ